MTQSNLKNKLYKLKLGGLRARLLKRVKRRGIQLRLPFTDRDIEFNKEIAECHNLECWEPALVPKDRAQLRGRSDVEITYFLPANSIALVLEEECEMFFPRARKPKKVIVYLCNEKIFGTYKSHFHKAFRATGNK